MPSVSEGPANVAQRLNNSEAAAYLGLKAATLEKWRVVGSGPPFVKIGRLVRYRKEDLDAFMQVRIRNSTSDTGESLSPLPR